MTLPDFLIVGPPKAGTTALHAALALHPQLFMSAVKEPRFFLCDGRPPPARGGPGDAQTYQEYVWRRADYERLFAAAPEGSLCGESSPFYLHDTDAHRRIRRLIPGAKLIAVLRDPVDRAHSNWAHLWSAGLEPYADFVEACSHEAERIEEGWAPFWQYTGLGKYGEQLDHLYDLFPREQVLLLRYRDLRDDPAATLDKVCEFLGVRTGLLTTVPSENVRTHVGQNPLNSGIRALLRGGAGIGHVFPLQARKLVREPLLSLLQRGGGRRPRITQQQRETILPVFAEDIRLLEKVTGGDYQEWLTTHYNTGSSAT